MILLSDLLNLAEAQARKILLEFRHQQLVSTYLLVGPQGQTRILACPWDGELDKQMMLTEVRTQAAKLQAVALSHLSEVWMTSHQGEVSSALPPSQSLDRQEAVLAVATDGIKTQARIFHIARDWKGQVSELLQQPTSPDDQFTGRMIDGLLPGFSQKVH